MRKLIMLTVAGGLFTAASLLQAAPREGKEVTIVGEALCGKCALKETPKCQNVVIVTKDGKETKYYLVHDAVAKKAHSEDGICKATKEKPIKVKVTGDVEEKDGKMMMTAEKIEKE